jgi:hypothetical protein
MSDQLAVKAATYTTRLTHGTDIHAPGGIRTHNPSNPAAADPRLRTHGRQDRPSALLL